MIIDGRTVPSGSRIEADVCIVGGGIAGITLALQFIGTGTTVALVESGGTRWDDRTQDLSAATSSGQAYFPVKETHLRVLGGSSLSYGGICAELPPLQFEKRPWVPDSGWPFPKQELDPYYPRAYELFEVGKVTEEPALPATAGTTEWRRVRFSPPTRFGTRYAGALDKAGTVTTYLHSTVTRIEAETGGSHINGVLVSTFGGNRYRIVARHYVLAGGGIEVPRLMLASNNVVATGIGNQHDNVGRYFQEHPRVVDRYWVSGRAAALTGSITSSSRTLRFSRLGLSETGQRQHELLDYHVNLSFGFDGQDSPQWSALRRLINAGRSPWKDSPYYQDIGGGPNRVRWADVKSLLARPDRTVRGILGATLRPRFIRRWVELQSSIEQVPRRDNRVVLTTAKDELGMPRAELRWSLDAREKHTYYRGRELVLEELERLEPGLSANRKDEPEQWPDHVLGTWHHSGTTRMSRRPRDGVVDHNARVHGTDNLFVAGSSVFPTSGSTGPSLTIACLSLRLADHLQARLRKPPSALGRVEAPDTALPSRVARPPARA